MIPLFCDPVDARIAADEGNWSNPPVSNHPNCYTVPQLGLRYVQIPKAGCTSIQYTLARSAGYLVSTRPKNIFSTRLGPTLQQLPGNYWPGGDGILFSVVRNPWDRLCSLYQNLRGRLGVAYHLRPTDDRVRFEATMGWQKFVETVADIPDEVSNRHYRAQSDFVWPAADGPFARPTVEQLIWFDQLAEGWRRLGRDTWLPLLPLPRFNSSPNKKPYHQWYDERLRELVAQRYANDIAAFDFEFGEKQKYLRLAHRNDLARWLPQGGRGAEIGVHLGDYASILLLLNKPERLYLFDSYADTTREAGQFNSAANLALVQQRFVDDPRVKIRKIESVVAARSFPDNYLDWVYIDANHTYACISADLEAWWPKIKPGGYLCGHDWVRPDREHLLEHLIEVRAALDVFMARHGVTLSALTGEYVYRSFVVQKPFSLAA